MGIFNKQVYNVDRRGYVNTITLIKSLTKANFTWRPTIMQIQVQILDSVLDIYFIKMLAYVKRNFLSLRSFFYPTYFSISVAAICSFISAVAKDYT